MLHDVIDLLARLPKSDRVDEFAVAGVCPPLYAAKSNAGELCAIVEFPLESHLPGGRQTRGLSLEFHPEFELTEGGTGRRRAVAVLRCREESLVHLFAVMIEGIEDFISRVPAGAVTPRVILEYVAQWQELLATRRELGLTEQVGLWGELWFVRQSPNPDATLRVWHGPEHKRFDFSATGADLDVKTSLQGHVHRFSLEQLQPSHSTSRRIIYSLSVEDDPAGGQAISDIIDELRIRIQDRLLLEKLLLKAGYLTREVSEVRLTARDARLVEACSVPTVTQYERGVTAISFQSDLEECPAIPDSALILNLFYSASLQAPSTEP